MMAEMLRICFSGNLVALAEERLPLLALLASIQGARNRATTWSAQLLSVKTTQRDEALRKSLCNMQLNIFRTPLTLVCDSTPLPRMQY
mmetsp:Transcript_18756/g.40368  ORF Transcript_18756/g.40368 Transcript_18756/m.40368 type:complete len:88 (+) Transcript_18756:1982-2245(+)